jgi:hypothetical protein
MIKIFIGSLQLFLTTMFPFVFWYFTRHLPIPEGVYFATTMLGVLFCMGNVLFAFSLIYNGYKSLGVKIPFDV